MRGTAGGGLSCDEDEDGVLGAGWLFDSGAAGSSMEDHCVCACLCLSVCIRERERERMVWDGDGERERMERSRWCCCCCWVAWKHNACCCF